jgi:hypothetical protein
MSQSSGGRTEHAFVVLIEMLFDQGAVFVGIVAGLGGKMK